MTGERGLVLVTGASGYVGGELVAPLIGAGYRVRVFTRSPDRLADRSWRDEVELAQGDAAKSADLDAALAGVDVAYYLVHSMDGQGDFRARDRALAKAFAAAAERAGVARIIYLSGIHPAGTELSEHLASRVEVGEVFLDSAVPAAVLQAAVVLGGGSASFEMLRYLTERLPVMIAPRWLHSRIQPIAIDDAVHYLLAAAALPERTNRTFDIAGPDVLTYEQMIQRFASITGHRRRLILAVPVLTPGLAGHWVGFVTPVDTGVAKPLVGSLVHDVVAAENDLADLVGEPASGPTGFDDAIRAAMADQPSSGGIGWLPGALGRSARRLVGGIRR